MSNEKTDIYLRQGGMYFSIGDVTKEEIGKMNEIRRRDPNEDWSNRGLELLSKAQKELGK